MEIRLNRKYKKDTYTIGVLSVDGAPYCNTLEDKDRGLNDSMSVSNILTRKVAKQTAIPCGRYRITFTYSPKFCNRPYAINGMIPLINGVKGFSAIRMHDGKDERWTDGCVLCGKNTIKGKLTDGEKVCTELFKKMYDVWSKKGDVWITVE